VQAKGEQKIFKVNFNEKKVIHTLLLPIIANSREKPYELMDFYVIFKFKLFLFMGLFIQRRSIIKDTFFPKGLAGEYTQS
jgi:hypothetical protein